MHSYIFLNHSPQPLWLFIVTLIWTVVNILLTLLSTVMINNVLDFFFGFYF